MREGRKIESNKSLDSKFSISAPVFHRLCCKVCRQARDDGYGHPVRSATDWLPPASSHSAACRQTLQQSRNASPDVGVVLAGRRTLPSRHGPGRLRHDHGLTVSSPCRFGPPLPMQTATPNPGNVRPASPTGGCRRPAAGAPSPPPAPR